MLDELPNLLSLSLASKLAGLSTTAFKRLYVKPRLFRSMPTEFGDAPGARRGYVYRHELERVLGRKTTLAEVQAADRTFEARRLYQRL